MKVRVTATLTYETDLHLEDYDNFDDAPKTEDEIIAWELQQVDEQNSDMLDIAAFGGDYSDVKIERIEEDAPAKAEAA